MSYIDITLDLHNDLPVWPGSLGIRVTQTGYRSKGDGANFSRLDTDVHVGTHVDAPYHYFNEGHTVEDLDLDVLMGKCYVAEIHGVNAITADDLEDQQIPDDCRRLLLKTDNSDWWAQDDMDFHEDYVALTADAAEWMVDQGIELIGTDYCSIQLFDGKQRTHEALLEEEIIILEAVNLNQVEEGWYQLSCLPLKIRGSDGAPARAVLEPMKSK